MKKGKLLACIGLATLILPLSVNAAQEEISSTKTSSIDATINSVKNQADDEGYFYVSWGDFKFNYEYDADNSVGSWTPATAAGNQVVDEVAQYVPASNEINVSNAGMNKDMKATVSFNTNINGVSAQVFGETVDPKSGEVESALQQLPDSSAIVSNFKEVDFDINLLGGDYETVKAEFDNGSKKIGTFTVTIEDAQ